MCSFGEKGSWIAGLMVLCIAFMQTSAEVRRIVFFGKVETKLNLSIYRISTVIMTLILLFLLVWVRCDRVALALRVYSL